MTRTRPRRPPLQGSRRCAATAGGEDMGDGGGGGGCSGSAPLGGSEHNPHRVDMGGQNCFIKVQAPDRRGLLHPQISSAPAVDVRRAAVTTDTDQMGGTGHRYLELDIRDGPRISSDEVKRRLQRSLYEAHSVRESGYVQQKAQGEGERNAVGKY